MPADAGIYGQQTPVKINTPFENLSQVLQVRAQQQQIQSNQALEQERRAKLAEDAQKRKEEDAYYQILAGPGTTDDRLEAIRSNPITAKFYAPTLKSKQDADKSAADTQEAIGKAAEAQANATEKMQMHQAGQAQKVIASGYNPAMFTAIAQHELELFPQNKEVASALAQVQATAPEQQPGLIKQLMDGWGHSTPASSQAMTAAAPPRTVQPGEGVRNAAGGYDVPIAKEPTKPSSALEYEYAQKQGYKGTYEQYQNEDANRKKPVVNVFGIAGLYNATDPKAIAAGIRAGEMPPDISQYGRPVQGAVASELTKPGPNGERFNLADAQRTWAAQKRLNSTMNGAQQVRIDQSIKSGMAMYDKVDELADEWKGKGLGPLSRANLIVAKNGGMGPKAADIAIRLEGQIAQLTSDVATLEQGGMTPTNEARAVAEKSLQAWWGNGTIRSMTAQGRANMKIRDLARQDQGTFVGGNAGGNVVTGGAAPAATAPAAAAPPAQTGGALHKVGDTVVGPDGKPHKVLEVSPDGKRYRLDGA